MKVRLFLIVLFFILLGMNFSYGQLPYGHGICLSVVDNVTDIDIAQDGIVWYTKSDSTFWFTSGSAKFRIPIFCDSLSIKNNLIVHGYIGVGRDTVWNGWGVEVYDPTVKSFVALDAFNCRVFLRDAVGSAVCSFAAEGNTFLIYNDAGNDYINFTTGQGTALSIKTLNNAIGIGTTSPVANSLTLGTKAIQRDVIWTRENTPTGTDSSGRGYVLAGNSRITQKATDGDSTFWTIDADTAKLASNNVITIQPKGTYKGMPKLVAKKTITYFTRGSAQVLVALPADGVVWSIQLEVTEAFNGSGTDLLDIGVTGTGNHYKDDLDVSGTIALSVETAMDGNVPEHLSGGTNIIAQYFDENSDATAGSLDIYVEYTIH